MFDAKPHIRGSWYGELRSQAYFSAVRIVDVMRSLSECDAACGRIGAYKHVGDGYGIEWPNGQDLAPHELYGLGALA